MSEQVSDHIDASAGIGDVAPAGVPQLMRADRGVQGRAAGRCCQQLPDRVRPHRRADLAAEQVDDQEIAAAARGTRIRSNS